MFLSKLTNLLSSTLTLGPCPSDSAPSETPAHVEPELELPETSSQTPSETLGDVSVPESLTVVETNHEEVDLLKSFFDKLTLKELVYEPDLSFTDDLPSTKFPLTYRPATDDSRALDYVMKLGDGDDLRDAITYFFAESATVKEKEQDILELNLSLMYNSMAMTEAFGFDPYHIYNRQDLLYALERGPIRSAEKLAKSIDDTISHYHFMTPRGINGQRIDNIDPLLLTYINYPNEPFAKEKSFVRCVLVPFAPWEYTSGDFNRFTNMGVYMGDHGNTDVMWTFILDACVAAHCEYFILTTYENWAFGKFSQTFGEAFISEPISNKSQVMKYLTYWILSSCYTTDTMIMDQPTYKLGYELLVPERKRSNSNEAQDYIIRMRCDERVRPGSPVEDANSYDMPEPIKKRKWNRWYKEDPVDEKEDGSSEEIGKPDDVVDKTEDVGENVGEGVGDGGTEDITEKVMGDLNEGIQEKTEEKASGEDVVRGVKEGVGEDDSGGVGEDVMQDMDGRTNQDMETRADGAEHEAVLEVEESSHSSTIDKTPTMDVELEV